MVWEIHTVNSLFNYTIGYEVSHSVLGVPNKLSDEWIFMESHSVITKHICQHTLFIGGQCPVVEVV